MTAPEQTPPPPSPGPATVAKLVSVATLKPAPWNPRTISDERFSNLCRSIEADPQFLWLRPVLANKGGIIYGGNMRYRAARHLGITKIPAIVVDIPDELARERAMRDNGSWGEWQKDDLSELLKEMEAQGSALDILGFNQGELDALLGNLAQQNADKIAGPSLADRFVVPPFSVLDARQGYWQDRKRQWLAIGIRSEIGRGENLLHFSETVMIQRPGGAARRKAREANARTFGQDLMKGEHVVGQPETASLKGGLTLGTTIHPYDETGRKRNKRAEGKPLTWGDTDDAKGNLEPYRNKTRAINDHTWQRENLDNLQGPQAGAGTSIFDPVLCELSYRWFSPNGGTVLDPFAGGSVRGIVASRLGRAYTGVDLSERQVEANRIQAGAIANTPIPEWIVGDSSAVDLPAADYVFSCPPYFDLEVYSDDPRDLSVMKWEAFLDVYRTIIARCAAALRENRFATFVVGDIRAPGGHYRNFVGETVRAFADAGMPLWNEAILVTAVGSLPIRAGKQFVSSRKLGKTHQNVLTFVKGNPVEAVAACGEITVEFPAEGLA